jgi:hypothetical protein
MWDRTAAVVPFEEIFWSTVKIATVGILRLLVKCNFRLINQWIIMMFVDDFLG